MIQMSNVNNKLIIDSLKIFHTQMNNFIQNKAL